MKKNLPIIVLIVLALLAASSFIVMKYNPNILVSAPAAHPASQVKATSSEIIFFYGSTCPHCLKVEQFFTDNNVEAKVKFTKDEVFNNKDNAALLGEKAAACGLNTDSIGVPFLWDGSTGKCLEGDVDVINFFKAKIGQ
jgi:glutaredoxin